ncbi:hypothetical protein O5255_26505 [Escherichia coli]|nr:hypothetical protein [Escherichia coli]
MPERHEHLSDELCDPPSFLRHCISSACLPVIGYFGGEPYQGLLAEKWCLEGGLHLFPEPVQDTDTDFICNLIAIPELNE